MGCSCYLMLREGKKWLKLVGLVVSAAEAEKIAESLKPKNHPWKTSESIGSSTGKDISKLFCIAASYTNCSAGTHIIFGQEPRTEFHVVVQIEGPPGFEFRSSRSDRRTLDHISRASYAPKNLVWIVRG